MKCIWLNAKPRERNLDPVDSPRFDCWQPPTNTHIIKSAYCFMQSQMIQSISKTFRFSWNCSKKKGQPLPGRKGWCWAAFTAPPLFFLASERVARSPVAKAFPSLTCQPWDDLKVHATCWHVLPNSGWQWLGSGDLDFVLPSLISASFSETASLKR